MTQANVAGGEEPPSRAVFHLKQNKGERETRVKSRPTSDSLLAGKKGRKAEEG